MPHILTDILNKKFAEVRERKALCPQNRLETICADLPATRSLRAALENSETGIIAEFKRRSPSKGWIRQDAAVEDIIPAYVTNGASAHSILTDNSFFGGTLADIETARPLTPLPILRKEFIVDSYQLYEARAAKADVVLLIAAALTPTACRALAAEARSIGLEVLLEIHNEGELDHYSDDVSLIGVNNRNLGSFRTDPEVSLRLADRLPSDVLHISESGLRSPDVLRTLREAGYRGFLIGEAFMCRENPGEALAEYIKNLQPCM